MKAMRQARIVPGPTALVIDSRFTHNDKGGETMASQFSRRPIAQQLIIVSTLALFLVFAVMTLVVQINADRAAIAVAETNLGHEARFHFRDRP
jgi:hypothetical protein